MEFRALVCAPGGTAPTTRRVVRVKKGGRVDSETGMPHRAPCPVLRAHTPLNHLLEANCKLGGVPSCLAVVRWFLVGGCFVCLMAPWLVSGTGAQSGGGIGGREVNGRTSVFSCVFSCFLVLRGGGGEAKELVAKL